MSAHPSDPRRSLLGAYAIGAVEPSEHRDVEDLLLTDHDARAEFHALQLGAAWLAAADPRPDPRVWQGIARAMQAGRREARFSRRRRWMGVAAALTLGALLAGGLLQGSAPVDDVRALDGTTVVLRGDENRALETVLLADGTGYVLSSSLPALEDATYQLWAMTPSGPRSAAVLGNNPAVRKFRVPHGTTELALTKEPPGGSAAPTSTPIASATVPKR